jgi:HlyD family secretion protein
MNGPKRIPVPWKHRWRRFRYTSLPMFSFLAFAGAAAWLWTHATQMPHAIGEVEAVRFDLSSSAGGVLKTLPMGDWKLLDSVEAGQVIAQLDDRLLRAQIETIRKELVHSQKELDAEAAKLAASEADREESHFAEETRLRMDAEKLRLAVLEQRVVVETDRLEARRTSAFLECIQPLYEKKMISEQELVNARMYRDQAAQRLEEDIKVADEADRQQKAAAERLEQLPAFLPSDAGKMLGSVAAGIEIQEKRIGELEVQIEQLTIRSPIRGKIVSIYRRANENVPAGEPIMTIASDVNRYLVSYIRQEQHVEPKLGMAVDVRKRAAVNSAVESAVESVGPQVEPVPQHLCRDPKIPEWGLPVRIALPKDFPGRPGELFEITFKTNGQGAG